MQTTILVHNHDLSLLARGNNFYIFKDLTLYDLEIWILKDFSLTFDESLSNIALKLTIPVYMYQHNPYIIHNLNCLHCTFKHWERVERSVLWTIYIVQKLLMWSFVTLTPAGGDHKLSPKFQVYMV